MKQKTRKELEDTIEHRDVLDLAKQYADEYKAPILAWKIIVALISLIMVAFVGFLTKLVWPK